MSIPEDLKKDLEWFEDELKKMNEGDSGKQPEKSEYLKSLDECSGSLNELKEALFGKHPRRSAPNRSNPLTPIHMVSVRPFCPLGECNS